MNADDQKRMMEQMQEQGMQPEARRAWKEWQEQQLNTGASKAPDTVYAHVERTVHALLGAIASEIGVDDGKPSVPADGAANRIKTLAEAVQALSSWPQFNPRDAYEQYQKIAEHHVERALKERLPR